MLVYPFTIKIVFRLETFRKSRIFSISDETGTTKLGLSFVPVNKNIIRMLLDSDSFPYQGLNFTVSPVERNKIMKILIHVTEKEASASLNCTLQETYSNFTEPFKKIEFNDGLKLHLGYSEESGVLKVSFIFTFTHFRCFFFQSINQSIYLSLFSFGL